MTGLTDRQVEILRGYDSRMLADIPIDPDHGIGTAKWSCYGRTGARVGGEEFWMDTTSRGIELYRWDGDVRRAHDVVTWSVLARLARDLPAETVTQLRERRHELTGSAIARPDVPIAASDEERRRWELSEYQPWLRREQAVRTRLDATLDAALVSGRDPQEALFDIEEPPPRVTARPHRPAPSRQATDLGQGPVL